MLSYGQRYTIVLRKGITNHPRMFTCGSPGNTENMPKLLSISNGRLVCHRAHLSCDAIVHDLRSVQGIMTASFSTG